jgi:hypothetical protein
MASAPKRDRDLPLSLSKTETIGEQMIRRMTALCSDSIYTIRGGTSVIFLSAGITKLA